VHDDRGTQHQVEPLAKQVVVVGKWNRRASSLRSQLRMQMHGLRDHFFTTVGIGHIATQLNQERRIASRSPADFQNTWCGFPK
jgi:hypothetical protein